MADRISELPAELLLNIISHLPFRDAVATCTLSRQWQYLWHSITAIKLGGSDPTPIHLVGKKCELAYDPEIRKQITLMKEYVERTRGSTLEEITVCYFMDTRYLKFVRFLFAFAMKKNVKKLHLESWVSSFAQSRLRPVFPLYDEIIPSKLLKDLHLSNVGLNQDDIKYLLSNCPVLEKLTLIDSHSLRNLKIVGPLELKELQIRQCGVLNTIEIRDAKLVRFSYAGDVCDLLLSNVPFLADVSIEILTKNLNWQSRPEIISSVCIQLELSGCLSRLQRLKFDVRALGYRKDYVLWLLKGMALKVAANCKWDVVY